MKGILYGVGVGTGDPEMLTLKAVKCIRKADVLCLPKAQKEKCRAYRTALEAVPEIEDSDVLCLDLKMTSDRKELERIRDDAYEKISGITGAGKSVAFLMIGDPGIYSTFGYICERALKNGDDVRIINGITSFDASAASCGIMLCEDDEELHIISGQKDIKDALCLSGTKVILKCGKNISAVKKDILGYIESRKRKVPGVKAGCIEVYAVSECGLPEEKIYRGAENIPEDSGYMTTIIIKERR